jgi:tryptophan halogenase
VLNGQGIVAQDYNPLADVLDSATNLAQVRQVADVIVRAAPTLPMHDAALAAAMGQG